MDALERTAMLADVAEYAARCGIPFEAALGVYTLVGRDGLLRILCRK